MELAECERFPKDRPQAALTVARSGLVDSTHRTLALLGAIGSRIASPVGVDRLAAAIPASESPPP